MPFQKKKKYSLSCRFCAGTALALTMLVLPAMAQAASPTVVPISAVEEQFAYPAFLSADGKFAAGSTYPAGGSYYLYYWDNGTMTDIGHLGSAGGYVYFITADGSVVAGVSTPPTGSYHAYHWSNGILTDIGTLGGLYSAPSAMSDDGTVLAGTSTTASGETHVFRWEGGTIADLGTLGGGGSSTEVKGMSGDGSVIIGSSPDTFGALHAFRWEGTMLDLGTLGGTNSYASLVSRDGRVVVGDSDTATGEVHTFHWDGVTMTDLGTLGGVRSYAKAISADGSIVAGDSLIDALNYHAYRWDGTAMEDLGTLGGDFSAAQYISSNGAVVVGSSQIANGDSHVFRWEAPGGMADIGTLGGTQVTAAAMSQDGSVIAGTATKADFSQHVFRWTEGAGIQSLADILTNSGASLGHWSSFDFFSSMTPDGQVMSGVGMYDGLARAFIFNMSGTSGGITTPEELGQSLLSIAALPAQSQGLVAGHSNQSLFVARNAMSTYFADMHKTTLPKDVTQIEPAAGGYGSFGEIAENRNAFYAVGSFGTGNDTDHYSGNTGLLLRLTDDIAFGVGVLGSRSDQDTEFGGDSRINAAGGTMMLAYEPAEEGLRLYATTSIAKLDMDMTRNYQTGGAIASSSGETEGMGYGAAARAGYSVDLNAKTSIMPYGELEWSRVKMDGYTETGGPFPASVDDRSDSNLISRLGAELSYDVNSALTLRGRGAWAHRLSDPGDVHVNAATLSYTLPGADEDQNWAEGGVTGVWKATDKTMFSADLSGRTGETSEPSVNLMLGVSIAF